MDIIVYSSRTPMEEIMVKRFLNKMKRAGQHDIQQSYSFEDKLFFRKGDDLSVVNQEGHLMGYIIRTYDPIDLLHYDMTKKSIYSFQDCNGEMISSVGVKRRNGLDTKGNEYLFQDHKQAVTYSLQKQKMSLTFRVKGHINDCFFEMAESHLKEELICRSEEKMFAVIHYDNSSYKVEIEVLYQPHSSLIHPSFLTLMYCIFRMEGK